MIAIIDYKAGNAPSVLSAVKKLGFDAAYVRDTLDLKKASHIILPGVGSAAATIDSLRELDLINALEDMVFNKKIPFMGICVGLQILFEHSEEDDTVCLGWLKGEVKRFDSSKVRVPQIGWNKVSFVKEVPIKAMDGYYYFVNSYRALLKDESDLWGVSDYEGAFTAAVRKDNIYATQFHIEKSGEVGLLILKGFIEEAGAC